MAVTHLTGLSITPSPRGATGLEVTGTTAFTGSPAVTGTLTVSKGLTVSGAFRATGSGDQSSVTKLAVSGTSVLSGSMTATGTSKTQRFSGMIVDGTFKIVSAANRYAGVRLFPTAGTSNIASTAVQSSSRIFVASRKISTTPSLAWVASIASGAHFKTKLVSIAPAGTTAGITGPVSWFFANQST